jgi:hypothetical protein
VNTAVLQHLLQWQQCREPGARVELDAVPYNMVYGMISSTYRMNAMLLVLCNECKASCKVVCQGDSSRCKVRNLTCHVKCQLDMALFM